MITYNSRNLDAWNLKCHVSNKNIKLALTKSRKGKLNNELFKMFASNVEVKKSSDLSTIRGRILQFS